LYIYQKKWFLKYPKDKGNNIKRFTILESKKGFKFYLIFMQEQLLVNVKILYSLFKTVYFTMHIW